MPQEYFHKHPKIFILVKRIHHINHRNLIEIELKISFFFKYTELLGKSGVRKSVQQYLIYLPVRFFSSWGDDTGGGPTCPWGGRRGGCTAGLRTANRWLFHQQVGATRGLNRINKSSLKYWKKWMSSFLHIASGPKKEIFFLIEKTT